jgi:hypothetical protein
MARVDTLPTLTVVEVIPVWSLKALGGMVRPEGELAAVVPVEPLVVVVDDDELVELHATAVVATRATSPSAAMRVFHDAELKAPP